MCKKFLNYLSWPLFVLSVGLLGSLTYADAALKPAAESSTVLIRHGTAVVTEADFEAKLLEAPEKIRDEIRTNPERISAILEALYVQKRLAQEARDNQMDQDPLLRKRMELAADRLLAQARLDAVAKQMAAPDFIALAKEQYLAHPERAEVPEQVHAAHILITTKQRSEDEARKLAEQVRAEALQDKQSFAELAKKYSEDPSGQKNGGDLGFFARGAMVKPFEEVAFAMKKPGEISPIVKSEFGFHIIRFEARAPAEKRSFEEVKESLMREVKENHEKQVRTNYLQKINDMTGVDMNSEAIKKLRKVIPLNPSQKKKTEPTAK